MISQREPTGCLTQFTGTATFGRGRVMCSCCGGEISIWWMCISRSWQHLQCFFPLFMLQHYEFGICFSQCKKKKKEFCGMKVCKKLKLSHIQSKLESPACFKWSISKSVCICEHLSALIEEPINSEAYNSNGLENLDPVLFTYEMGPWQ